MECQKSKSQRVTLFISHAHSFALCFDFSIFIWCLGIKILNLNFKRFIPEAIVREDCEDRREQLSRAMPKSRLYSQHVINTSWRTFSSASRIYIQTNLKKEQAESSLRREEWIRHPVGSLLWFLKLPDEPDFGHIANHCWKDPIQKEFHGIHMFSGVAVWKQLKKDECVEYRRPFLEQIAYRLIQHNRFLYTTWIVN